MQNHTSTVHQNFITKRMYTGKKNILTLESAGYKNHERLTHYQIKQLGGRLTDSSKGVAIFYKEEFEVKDKENKEAQTIFKYKKWIVYNIETVDLSNTINHSPNKITPKQYKLLEKLINESSISLDEKKAQLQKIGDLSKTQATNEIKSRIGRNK